MVLLGFEGAAGTGKTHRLMEAIGESVRRVPLESYQRVLALTFMHGSRRRLDERLYEIPELRRKYECRTIDSFATALLERWRSLAKTLGIGGTSFDEICEAGGRLLEQPTVARWVARTHPVVVVDEAQELSSERLKIVRALATVANTYLAADAFQCLDERVDTTPFIDWMHTGEVLELRDAKRTSVRGLLDAARSIRNGAPPASGDGIEIRYEYPNNVPFVVGQALRRVQGTSALLTAPGNSAWAQKVVERLQKGMKSKKQAIPPIRIAWERRTENETERLISSLPSVDTYSAVEITEAIKHRETELPPWAFDVARSVQQAERIRGKTSWSPDEVKALVSRKGALYSAHWRKNQGEIPALSIHGAKNREFPYVVVLWPYGVQGSDDYKRRLLYNAITRAQKTCNVFVQGKSLLNAVPFR